jgi:hypothetical protein
MIWSVRLGILAFVGVIAVTSASLAGEERGHRNLTIRENPFLDGEYDLLDSDGRRVGAVRKNPFIEGEYEIRDRDGKRTGKVRENPFLEDKLEVDGR